MRGKRYYTLALFISLIVMAMGGWFSQSGPQREADYYYKIKENLTLFGRVYEEISTKYVEAIDPEKFLQAGIKGMLECLDPYTVYFEKGEREELQIITSGEYGGLGMRIGMRDGVPTVVEPPFEGTPALKAGIREGDKIIEVDGQPTKGMSISETASRLRGEPGTEVTVKILREGEPEPLEFRLVRAVIHIKDVPYYGFVKDRIGYIKLNHFSRNAGQEVEKAIKELKSQGLKALILDLRTNPGGLLESAVEVADKFLPKGELIVYTKGRIKEANREYRAQEDPILGDIPLAVLVNSYSASASEIVSGAIQDLDRGVVIGTSTFGKGLVQTFLPLNRDSGLKITTAKYYIPSGRCIQKPDVFRKKGGNIFVLQRDLEEQEERGEFRTAGGRIVYGGGGIRPDIVVEPRKLSELEKELLRKSMLFNYAVSFAVNHRDLPRDFEVDDAMIEDFKTYLIKKGFSYKIEGEEELEKLSKIAEERNYNPQIKKHIQELKRLLQVEKEKEFQRSLDFIKRGLKREISAKLWGRKAEIEASFEGDRVLQKAIEILSEPKEYTAILTGR